MRITQEPDRVGLRFIIDPHDGACQGAHDIVVLGLPIGDTRRLHVSVSWGTSVFLSVGGTTSFGLGLVAAIDIAQRMERDGLDGVYSDYLRPVP